MKTSERMEYLQNNHFVEWIQTREKVSSQLSGQQPIFCCCGKLATGLHEDSCTKFKNKVNKETINRLKHL